MQKRCGAIAMCKRIIGIYFQGSFDLTNRLHVIAALVIDDPEQMQTIKMTGLSPQDVPIHLFGLRQLSGPMQRKRITER